jgi:hypothetical protein
LSNRSFRRSSRHVRFPQSFQFGRLQQLLARFPSRG